MNENVQKAYDRLNRISRVTLIVTTLAFVLSPFAFSLALDGSLPNFAGFWSGFLKVGLIYIPVAVVEFLIYAPMLGKLGTPIAFITGEITALKIPCVMNARDIAKVEAGTMENEIVSTIAVTVSSLVVMTVVFVGVVAMIPLTPVLSSPTLAPAFEMVIPALFGALGFKYFKKSLTLSSVPLLAAAVTCVLAPSMITQTSVMLIPIGALALVFGFFLFKQNKLPDMEGDEGM